MTDTAKRLIIEMAREIKDDKDFAFDMMDMLADNYDVLAIAQDVVTDVEKSCEEEETKADWFSDENMEKLFKKEKEEKEAERREHERGLLK